MNTLFLIGNGFDLAHGMPTSYYDFVSSYLVKALENANNGGHNDKLMTITNDSHIYVEPDAFTEKDLKQGINFLKNSGYRIDFRKNNLFDTIVNELGSQRWVDVEYLYYSKLRKQFKNESLNPGSTSHGVRRLNRELVDIKYFLVDYLNELDISSYNTINSIAHILSNQGKTADVMYLNFNYTNTLTKYLNAKYYDKINYIHGNIKTNNAEDIIFGYGDEMDPSYSGIENLNMNNYLEHIKSFGYFKNDNYQKLLAFINSPYEVKILGHSCGISDRLLLNTILENDNCSKVQIFYYEKSKKFNDFFVKTQELSRHFSSLNKAKLREKIVPFSKSFPLVPCS